MADQTERTRRSLPVLGQVPPPPKFDPSEVPPKPRLYWQMTWNVTKKIVRAPISIHTWMALRRTVLPQLLPEDVLYRWKPYRKGECNRCGACCKIQFQCSFMVRDEGELTHCSIYQSEHVPQACVAFPTDPHDLHMLQREIGEVCTFYFEGAPEPIPPLEMMRIMARHLYDRGVKYVKSRRRRPALESAD